MKFREYQVLTALQALGGIATYAQVANWSKQNPRIVWSTLCRLDPYVVTIGNAETNNNAGAKLYRLTSEGESMVTRGWRTARCWRYGS